MQEANLQLGQGCLSPNSETSGKCQYASSPCSHYRVDWGWMPNWLPQCLVSGSLGTLSASRAQHRDKHRQDHSLWFDAPSRASDSNKLVRERADALQSRVLHYHMGKMDRDGDIPSLTGKLKVDWIDFPVEDILEQSTTLKEGIRRGVFRHKAAAPYFDIEKDHVTVLLPGQLDVCSWLEKIDSMSHSWPKSCVVGKLQVDDLQARTFHLHRKFTRARHLWLSLRPDSSLMRTHMYTDWSDIHSYAQLNDRLFTNPGRNDHINDTPCPGGYFPAYQEWMRMCLGMCELVEEEDFLLKKDTWEWLWESALVRLTFHRFTLVDLVFCCFLGGCSVCVLCCWCFVWVFLFIVFCLLLTLIEIPLVKPPSGTGKRLPHTFCNITTVAAVMARTASDQLDRRLDEWIRSNTLMARKELRKSAKRLNPKAQTLVSQKFSNPASLQLFSRQHEKDQSPKRMA